MKGARKRPTMDPLSNWSWLSAESPLMSSQSEGEWILERLGNTLCRELRTGHQVAKRPPIRMDHVQSSRLK